MQESSITTKEHMKEIMQAKSDKINSSFVEMEAKIQVAYKETIVRQALNITEQASIIAAQQKANAAMSEALIISKRKTMNLEGQNESQRIIIKKLNAELDQTYNALEEKVQSTLRLTTENQRNQSQGAAPGSEEVINLSQFRALIAEFQEADRKRKHDDM
jgi:hypothetical protein